MSSRAAHQIGANYGYTLGLDFESEGVLSISEENKGDCRQEQADWVADRTSNWDSMVDSVGVDMDTEKGSSNRSLAGGTLGQVVAAVEVWVGRRDLGRSGWEPWEDDGAQV